jgi:hypothetical protein
MMPAVADVAGWGDDDHAGLHEVIDLDANPLPFVPGCLIAGMIFGRIDPTKYPDDNRTSTREHPARPSEWIMQSQSPRRLSFIIVVTLLTTLQSTPPAWAWGRLGHRVIARLAEKHMTPEAKAAVAVLLEPGESLADASLWADENRGRLPKTAPWHYVDVPLDEPKYDSRFSGDVASTGCVVDKINEFRAVVNDKSKSVEDRRFALRFLIHLVEDLHMPLHVGDNHDRGGNDTQVTFFDEVTNMHSLWDTGMIERFSQSEDEWLKELAVLASPQSQETTSEGAVEDWATESLLAARAAYLVPGTGKRIMSGQKLDDEYQARHLSVMRQRLCQAALRLAMVLNEAFPEM